MGASWRRCAAPVLLLLLAAALAPVPPAAAGTAADPEVTDPAGDQRVDTGTVPVIPGFNDQSFDDVDVTAAYVTEFGPVARIVVVTTASWTTGSMTLTFNVTKGPTSLPSSTAPAGGRAFLVRINGTAVSGANGTAAVTTDGLRVDLPRAGLGATGGDLLTDLSVATKRTDRGNLQGLAQDDQTGTDAAGPGRVYAFARPPIAGHVRLDVLGGTAGSHAFNGTSTTGAFPSGSTVRLKLSNDGLDPDEVTLSAGRSGNLPVGTNLTQPVRVAAGASRTVSVAVTFPNGNALPAGDSDLTFTAQGQLGGRASAVLHVHVAGAQPTPGEREVKPAGLRFLTGAAEGMGLDGPFGSWAEAFLLALVVLLVILALYLLLALGGSTLAGEPAPEAPWPDEAAAPPARAAPKARAGPSGLAQTVRASPSRSVVVPVPAPAEEEEEEEGPEPAAPAAPAARSARAAPPPVPTAAAPMAIKIEEVRHEPQEPEAGQRVVTEVLLRNEGAMATLRLALSVDGKPAAERTVQVPSRATKAVELPWTAGPGDNRVRIQAFPA